MRDEHTLLETQIQAINRFPDQNPNPVMRMADDGHLSYANLSSRPILRALGVDVGHPIPAEIAARLRAAAKTGDDSIEVTSDHRTWALLSVHVADLGFYNIYGSDITGEKVVAKFPGQNPNPVLRVTPAGVLLYANEASAPIVSALGLSVGDELPAELSAGVLACVDGRISGPLEVLAGQRTYEILPVLVSEFGFINVYGTDVTAAREVARAREETERLLLNILPPPIADRLRAGERVIADRFEDATLLIADIVGFTEMSSHLSPDELVELLNDIFSVCDVLVERHGLEKVKTIGDAYMVVGGVPVPMPEHVERVADFALDMATAVDGLQEGHTQRVSFRIGISRGPVVAGVIGTKRTIYDVWGDTVNMASRMEMLGAPGRIHVSDEVRQRLGDGYLFESRGLIEVKGKGALPTWFLLDRR